MRILVWNTCPILNGRMGTPVKDVAMPIIVKAT
jgi:hypothetical protein